MRRQIPPITKYLLIINCVFFLVTLLVGGQTYMLDGQRGTSYLLNDSLGLHFFLSPDFHIHQLLTYMFMHGGYAHIFFNMFALWMFGGIIEQTWGAKRYLIFYLVCGLGAAFCQELAQFVEYFIQLQGNYPNFTLADMFTVDFSGTGVTVGASGAIYGLLLAFGMSYPEERLFIIPIPFPIKAKWYVVGLMVLDLLSAISTSNDGVAHLAHLGGILFGFLLIKYWQRRAYGGTGQGWHGGSQFFNRMRGQWGGNRSASKWHTVSTHPNVESDWDYNARKKQEEDEIDRILDKIRQSGYDSLSKAEKLKLFNQSKKN